MPSDSSAAKAIIEGRRLAIPGRVVHVASVERTIQGRKIAVLAGNVIPGKRKPGSHFSNPAVGVAMAIRQALTMPRIAPVKLLNAAGQQIGTMDPLTRKRTVW